MSYATAAELQDRFGETLTQIVGEDPMTSKAVATALQAAAVELDSFLQSRFTLPLMDVPELLRDLACDVAIYRLLSLRPDQEVKDARARYKDAIERLEKIREGRLDLGLPQDQLPSRPAPVQITSSRRLFTRTSLRDA